VKFTESELHALWDEVANHSSDHYQWISDLDGTLKEIEGKRMHLVLYFL
jgi:hypothetical protein